MKTNYTYIDLTKYGSFSSDAVYKREGDDGTFDKLIQCREGN